MVDYATRYLKAMALKSIEARGLEVQSWLPLMRMTAWGPTSFGSSGMPNYCIPVANVAAHSQLRSTSRHQVVVPRYNTSTFGRRALSVGLELTARQAPRPIAID